MVERTERRGGFQAKGGGQRSDGGGSTVAGGADHSRSLVHMASSWGQKCSGRRATVGKVRKVGGEVRSSNRKSDPITGSKESPQRPGGTALRTDVRALLMCRGCFLKHQGAPLLS